jgi:hypothetical protein
VCVAPYRYMISIRRNKIPEDWLSLLIFIQSRQMLEWQLKVHHGRLIPDSAYFMFNDNKPVRRYIRYDNETVY